MLLERAIGGAVTLVLAAVGFLLAIGRYPIGPYLWIEARLRRRHDRSPASSLFSAVAAPPPAPRRAARCAALRVERPVRAAYEGIHGYRAPPGHAAAWSSRSRRPRRSRGSSRSGPSAASVGIDLSLRPYIVLGPLLFLVMLVPFTVNGLGVREAFFVSFLGTARRRAPTPPSRPGSSSS